MEELDAFPSPPPPGFADPASFKSDQVDSLLVLMKGGLGRKSRLVPLSVSVPPNKQSLNLPRSDADRRWNSSTPTQSCAR